jgi:hypothetical protein
MSSRGAQVRANSEMLGSAVRQPCMRRPILEAPWARASSHMVGMGTRQDGIFRLGRITRFMDGIRSSADLELCQSCAAERQSIQSQRVRAICAEIRALARRLRGSGNRRRIFHENGLALVTTLSALAGLPLWRSSHPRPTNRTAPQTKTLRTQSPRRPREQPVPHLSFPV